MGKIRLGIIFGGISTEHDVSIVSGTSVIKNLNKEKYEIYPIYISKEGKWYHYTKKIEEIDLLEIGKEIEEKKEIANQLDELKKLDVVFPVLHGLGGEDGTIQGLLELLKIPYVGCKVLASSIGMDKAYTKVMFEKANINQAEYIYVKKAKENYYLISKDFSQKILPLELITEKVEKTIGLPVFVKPSNSGSSVGIRKAKDKIELEEAIGYAAQFDSKILIEKNITGHEVECAVLGNEEVIASSVGEILAAEDFYTYDAKYKNQESKVVIPANISNEIIEEIRKLAIKAFQAIDGKGLARVDFFVGENNKIYINEINTMPGFTTISMYPKLWKKAGIPYSTLLDKLIQLALEEK